MFCHACLMDSDGALMCPPCLARGAQQAVVDSSGSEGGDGSDLQGGIPTDVAPEQTEQANTEEAPDSTKPKTVI